MSDERKYRQDPAISCFVPVCKNTALMCRNKYFFYVPQKTRKEWCSAVYKSNAPKGSIYICEDHLNLEEDLLNYEAWQSDVVRGKLTPRVPIYLKNVVPDENLTNNTVNNATPTERIVTMITQQDKSTACSPETHDKAVQVKPKMVDRSTNTPKLIKLKNGNQGAIHMFIEELTDIEGPSVDGSTSVFTET